MRPHQIVKTKFSVDGKELVATLCTPSQPKNVGLLRLAGGANAPHSPNTWQVKLAAEGVTTMAFDFSGVGESDGTLAETNLLTRSAESRAAYRFFLRESRLSTKSIFIMGGSMGGPLAIWLSNKEELGGLVLSVPAAYSLESHNRNFGPDFSAAIRQPDSWKNSQEFGLLEKFPGKILLIYAEHDEVIPREITDKYIKIVRHKDGAIVGLDSSHRFMREESPEKDARDAFWNAVAEFVSNKKAAR